MFRREAHRAVLAAAWRKVEAAYRSAATDLRQALDLLLGNTEHRQRCLQGLRIENPELLLRGAAALAYDLDTASPSSPPG